MWALGKGFFLSVCCVDMPADLRMTYHSFHVTVLHGVGHPLHPPILSGGYNVKRRVQVNLSRQMYYKHTVYKWDQLLRFAN